MFTIRISTVAAVAVALAAAGAVVVGAAPAASADANQDAAFLAQMYQQGVTFSSPNDAVTDAQAVCLSIANGETPVAVAREVIGETDLTVKQAAYFVGDAVNIYCDEYSYLLG
ncbi:DUF732 domain-containing protein [Nocardia sp. alder85J]|uniref:DUF732 domain-containing protein n=1 Tax=Nocardia sp. alder85J TaxID=2862949 RepID=UPI001CD7D73E|nr:DUF732 domain-containing protein [Nocardia sp. alder85J]MCX4093200.1 DUF732 domain-containing protein [Nocardia sp. alder85J]